jgi:hypothetical protein
VSGLSGAADLLAAISRALARPPSSRDGEPDGDASRANSARDEQGAAKPGRGTGRPSAQPGQQPCFPAAPRPDGGCVPPSPAPEEGCFPAGPFPSARRGPFRISGRG